MADIQRMIEALKGADKAGDTDAATRLAQAIRQAQSSLDTLDTQHGRSDAVEADYAKQAARMTPTDLSFARAKDDGDFGNYLRNKAKQPLEGETESQYNKRLYGDLETERPGHGEALLRSGLEGITHGGGGEVTSAIAATLDPLFNEQSVEGFLPRFKSYLNKEDQKLAKGREDYPASTTAAEIGASIPTAALPFGAAGKALQAGGKGTKAAIGGAISGGEGLAYGFNSGKGGIESRLDNAGKTAALTAPLGAVAPLVGSAVQKGANKIATSMARRKVNVSTPDELSAQAQAQYDRAKALGDNIPVDDFRGFVTRAEAVAKSEGYYAGVSGNAESVLQSKSHAVIGALKEIADSGEIPDPTVLRKIINSAAGAADNDDARIGKILLEQFDEYIDTIAAGPHMRTARELWRRHRGAQTIEKLAEDARSDAPSYSASGYENALRLKFKQLSKNDKRMKFFTEAEQKAIKRVARGGAWGNTLRMLGKFAPTGVVSSTMSGGVGYALGGPVGAIALPTIGFAARQGAKASTMNKAKTAQALIANGGLAQGQAPKQIGRLSELMLQHNAPVAVPGLEWVQGMVR